MQKLKLTKRMMQAALLLGASRGYLAGFQHRFNNMKNSSSLAVAVATYTTFTSGTLPLSLGLGIGLGVLFASQAFNLTKQTKLTFLLPPSTEFYEEGFKEKQHETTLHKIAVILGLLANFCLLIGMMCLQYYNSTAVVICIIALLNCVLGIINRKEEIVKTREYGQMQSAREGSAVQSFPKYTWMMIIIETLATLIATISAFTTISFWGVPIIMVAFYLKVTLVLFERCVSPLIPWSVFL